MAEIPLDVLEHMTKKDMESFILYLRNVLCSMPIQRKRGFPKQPLTVLYLHFLVSINT